MVTINRDMPYDPKRVGNRLRALRKEANVSQGKMAEFIGVTAGAVGNWEQGQQRPTIVQAEKIVAKFGVTLDFIFLGRVDGLSAGRGATLLKHEQTAQKEVSNGN